MNVEARAECLVHHRLLNLRHALVKFNDFFDDVVVWLENLCDWHLLLVSSSGNRWLLLQFEWVWVYLWGFVVLADFLFDGVLAVQV